MSRSCMKSSQNVSFAIKKKLFCKELSVDVPERYHNFVRYETFKEKYYSVCFIWFGAGFYCLEQLV